MQENIERYVPFIYLLAAIPYAWLGLYAWRKRPAVAVTPFAWAMLAMSIWSFMYGVEIFFRDLASKLFFIKLEYIGIASIPVFLLIFAFEYTGRSYLLTARTRALLWIIPVTVLLLTFTNEYHHLMWGHETITKIENLYLVDAKDGPFFLVNVAYSYLLMAMAGLLLIMELIQRPGPYRVQASLIILGIVFPWLGSIINLARLLPVPNLDVTPLFFIPTGLSLSWAITRYRLLEILPLEHLTVLQNMKSGVIVLDSQKRILFINPIAQSLFGRSESEVMGQPLSRISDLYGEALASFLESKKQQTEIQFGEDEQSKVYEVTLSPVASLKEPNKLIGPDIMLLFHDITERKDAETALSRRESIMSAISLAAGKFLKESTWERHVPGVLESIGKAANVSRVYVFVNYTNDVGEILTSQCYEWVAPGISPQINNPAFQHVQLSKFGYKRWQQAFSRGEPIYGVTRDFPESEKDSLKQQNILSVAALPIFVQNQWWGFIGFDDCASERQWTETELEALHIVANIFGSAETRARTEQKLIRRQETLTLLHEIVQASLRTDDLKSMSQAIVESLGRMINANGCYLTLWDEEKKQTLPVASYKTHVDPVSRPVQPGQRTFTMSVLELGRTLVIEDINNSPYIDKNLVKDFSSRSLLALPLATGKRKLGSIILSFDTEHRFEPEEISISEQASELIALALERFQSMEQAKHRANVSETLRKAGMALTETVETNQAMALILEQLKQVIDYDSASIQLLDGNELEIVGGSGWEDLDKVLGVRFPIPGNNPNSVVIETGRPYILSDVGENYSAFRLPPHDHIHSWLGVPLILQQKIIGLLAIDSSKPGHFTKESENIALEFADQVAIVLKNTRLLEETRKLAIIDVLTGLYNRRGLFELGKIEFGRSHRLNRPFSAIMLDIDRFKEVNDTYSHDVGDKVLQEVARRCKKCLREIDLIGRYGGEEIVALLPETSLEASMIVAERLRNSIINSPIEINPDLFLDITASFGVAHKDDNTQNMEILIARADQAMYVAKHKGRDRVVVASDQVGIQS